MASLVKDSEERSPYWYACFTDSTGRRLKKSTRQTIKAKAREVCRGWELAEKLARERTLTRDRTRKILSEVLERVTGEGLPVFSVEEWLEHFVKQKQKSRAAKTAARHAQMTDEFVRFLGPRARLNVATVTAKDISDFRDLREQQGLAPATINLDITILSSAFRAAQKQGHINVNPCGGVESLPDKAERKGTFTPEQVAALVNAAEGDWRGLILVAFYIGARLGDCANLRWKNIDLVSSIPTIRYAPQKGGTAGKEVVVVVHPALGDFLLTLPSPATDEAFLLPTLAGRAVSPLSKAFRNLMERAKIEQRVIRERRTNGRSVNSLTFHSLRHSFASALANAGVSEEVRMALTGHTERDTHKRYTHHELAALRDAVAVLPSIAITR
ncbi:MAG: site-specific integrase [Chthoniobacterales bacterium]|nr:site-specific integrase [Chthoniobacterales bacterium]